MVPILQLLGLMGLGAGALGVNRSIENATAQQSSDRIKEMLGTAPSLMYPNNWNPETGEPPTANPGSGLMAAPADPRKQLEFAQGIMALPPGEREAAMRMFGGLMEGARQSAVSQAQLSQQGKQFQSAQEGIDQRFRDELAQRQSEFKDNQKRFGETAALERYRVAEEVAQRNRMYELQVLEASRKNIGQPGPGNALVNGPNGPQVVPIQGSDDWRKERDAQNELMQAMTDIDELSRLVREHGTESYGPVAAQMASRYGQIRGALAKATGMGVLQPSEYKILEEQLAKPFGPSWSYRRNDSILAGYDELGKKMNEKLQARRKMTSGWQGFEAAAGRPALPPGTVPVPPGR